MDYVDLYIYHIWDYKTPAEEILEGMNEAVTAGKVRYIGIANAYAYQVAKMNALAEKKGWAKFISVQNHYNLIMREEEREMFPFCHEENIAMTPYSALASGKLAKRPGETSFAGLAANQGGVAYRWSYKTASHRGSGEGA